MRNDSSTDNVTFVDGHVHIYDCFDLPTLLDSAFSNFQKEAFRQCQGCPFTGVLLLTETARDRWFDRLKQYAETNRVNMSEGIGSWRFHHTDEDCSLQACSSEGRSIYIIAGRQIVTLENLEIQALATTRHFEDGNPLETTIENVIESGAIPVIPWGFGKWIGRRGRILRNLLEQNRFFPLFLGDNGGRPLFWPRPVLFNTARQEKLRILSGSDPLPLPTESWRPGSFGFCFHGTPESKCPAEALKRTFLDPTVPLRNYGKLDNPLRFIRNQWKIQIAKRLQNKRDAHNTQSSSERGREERHCGSPCSMIRDLKRLSNERFDLLVVGGGIHGAALAWQASRAGLSVALIEKGDFGGGTSANTQKIIHGGLRYLQGFDLRRIRQSLRERKRLMSLAPHLIHPLPCLMPTYGHGMRGNEAMWIGLRAYDLIALNRKGLPDPSKHIPWGRLLSADETNRLIPSLPQEGLRGAAQWYDAICFNTERLVLAFIKSANARGATVANYVKAMAPIQKNGQVVGINAQDQLRDEEFEVRADCVVNCTGPWINNSISVVDRESNADQPVFAGGINIIVKQLFPHPVAVGMKARSAKTSRLYFVVPWRGKSILGTEWFHYDGHPDSFEVSEDQCWRLIHGFNSVYPAANLELGDVLYVHGGLVPVTEKPSHHDEEIRMLKHPKILNYGEYGMKGLIGLLGVKYTTAGDVAERVLRAEFPRVHTESLFIQASLQGGDIEDFSRYKTQMISKWKMSLADDEMSRLVLNYGTEVEKVLELAKDERESVSNENASSLDVIKGEALFAVREEMAQKLTDVILRRTDRGTAGPFPESDLLRISKLMAEELRWTETRRKSEINEVKHSYPPFLRSRF